MNKEEYQLWVDHPQTKQFHQYLLDFRMVIMEKWAHGMLSGDEGLMAMAKAQMAFEITDFDDDTISKFYKKEAV